MNVKVKVGCAILYTPYIIIIIRIHLNIFLYYLKIEITL